MSAHGTDICAEVLALTLSDEAPPADASPIDTDLPISLALQRTSR
jgi:hypothetical protein